jgi:uncharacterized protein (TIGR02996 family)
VTDGESLRRAVFNTPWDDALRLVYADWLMENGDEAQRALGDFIRVSTRLEQKRTRELMEEYGRLMSAHGVHWLALLPEPIRHDRFVEFRGGFVRGLMLTAAELIAHGPSIVQNHPIDWLRLKTYPTLKDAKKLVALPLRWDRIRTLWLTGPFTNHLSGKTILCEAGMVHLIHLQFVAGRIDADKVRMLTEWPRLDKLRSLSFLNTKFDQDAAARLFAHPRLAGVGTLTLSAAALGDAAARALIRSPFADGTGAVSLPFNPFTPPAWAQLRQRFGDRLTLE